MVAPCRAQPLLGELFTGLGYTQGYSLISSLQGNAALVCWNILPRPASQHHQALLLFPNSWEHLWISLGSVEKLWSVEPA